MTAREKIDAVGLDLICKWIESGDGVMAVAKRIGVQLIDVQDWLNDARRDPTGSRSARAVKARTAAAETFELEAVRILEETGEEVRSLRPQEGFKASALTALARERAQSCWRRASIRNPEYDASRKPDVTINNTLISQRLSKVALTFVRAGSDPPPPPGGDRLVEGPGSLVRSGAPPALSDQAEPEEIAYKPVELLETARLEATDSLLDVLNPDDRDSLEQFFQDARGYQP